MQLACRLFSEICEEAVSTFGVDNDLSKYLKSCLGYAERHRTMIERFGRFPHRNKVLGREDTDEEKKAREDGTLETFT